MDYDSYLDRTYLITAGHVCLANRPGITGLRTYTLLSRKDLTYKADEVKRMFDHTMITPVGWPADLCLLKHDGYIAEPLPLSQRYPELYERVFYVGAPSAVWGEGRRLCTKGDTRAGDW